MKGIIRINKLDEEYADHYEIGIAQSQFGYSIGIESDLSEPFKDLVSKNHAPQILSSLKEQYDMFKDDTSEVGIKTVEFINKCYDKIPELLANAEFVHFPYDNKEVADYLQKNPELNDKKIILSTEFIFDNNFIDEIRETFSNNVDNLYFMVQGNSNVVCFSECIETLKKLNTIVVDVKRFNFSPLEQIMYVYDYVRDREYIEEDEFDDKSISRDLTKALLGERIVCTGFSNIFNAILMKLGIKSNTYDLKGNPGHSRNIVHVNDSKYGVDGVYFFDTTWDSKCQQTGLKFLDSYKFFCKTKEEIEPFNTLVKITDNKFPYYSPNIVEEFEFMLNNNQQIPTEYYVSLQYMSKYIYNEDLFHPLLLCGAAKYVLPTSVSSFNTEKVINLSTSAAKYFNKKLTADTLLEVLFNVRKIEYYMNPEKYKFDLQTILTIFNISNWDFEVSPREKLMETILGDNKQKIKRLGLYGKKTDYFKRVSQIEFTNTLRNITASKIK